MEIQIGLKEKFAIDRRWHIFKDKARNFSSSLINPIINSLGKILSINKATHKIVGREESHDDLNKQIKDLEELNEHKENILSLIAHDLRSPLASIISIADHLKSNFTTIEPAEASKMINYLYDSSKEELFKLDSLVEWARVKYASETFSPKNIAIRQSVNKVLNTLNQLATENNIKLYNTIPLNITVFADEKMLDSILQNIISNAIKYSHKGDQVSINVTKETKEIIIEVKDNGIGMSNEVKAKLFTPQMEILSKVRKEKKGAGIGLLMTKKFIEKNGGRIWIKSEIGIGTTFFFTLPINNSN